MASYHVTVKPSHPSGTFYRDGRQFSATAPVMLTDAEMTDAIKNEPWLVVKQVDGGNLPPSARPASTAETAETAGTTGKTASTPTDQASERGVVSDEPAGKSGRSAKAAITGRP